MNGGLNTELPFEYRTSEYRTSKSSLFRCFRYSDVRYSDPHCNLTFTLLAVDVKKANLIENCELLLGSYIPVCTTITYYLKLQTFCVERTRTSPKKVQKMCHMVMRCHTSALVAPEGGPRVQSCPMVAPPGGSKG